MRIALLGDFPVDPTILTGGPQSVLAYLIKGFEHQPSIELHVVTLATELSQNRTTSWAGATIHYLAKPRIPVELLFPWIRRQVHQCLRAIKPQLVHAQDSRLSSWLAIESGFPTLVTVHSVHGQETQYRSRFVERARISLHERVLYNHFRRHVEHLVCISPYIESEYAGVLDSTMHSIENPIDDAFFNLDPMGSIPGRVLFAGLLNRRKRPDLLIEAATLAAPLIPGLSVQIAGAAQDARLLTRLHQLVNLAGLERHVTFLGHLSEPELLDEYQSASVLVLTSDQETSPMVIQQAMAAGKPVIATRVGGVPYLIDHGRNGLLADRGDAQAIANYLRQVLLQPDLARELGRCGREDALARFQARSVAARMAVVYQSLVDSQPAGARPLPVTSLSETDLPVVQAKSSHLS